jgi:meckelin
LIQYLFYIIFYQRFIEDRLLNFIDLCSVSNISVFILTDNQYGYYIHGRSPHGTTDVNMRDMIMNLERESKQMSGTRGLEAESDEQTFIVRINGQFRLQYEAFLRDYEVKKKQLSVLWNLLCLVVFF